MKNKKVVKKSNKSILALNRRQKRIVTDVIRMGIDSRKSLERFQLSVSEILTFIFMMNEKMAELSGDKQ